MGRRKKETGNAGEMAAASYLRKKGYRVVERNYRTVFGEIDIVARLAGLTVFVEVKTRATSSFGPPYLAITKVKEAHMIKNALFYLKSHRLAGAHWRIDIVSVKMDASHRVEDIELFENATEHPYV